MSDFDETQSYNEGWLASTCLGSSYFPEGWMQIERFDEKDAFQNDWEALAFVAKRAAEGSLYHARALEMIDRSNFSI